MRVKRTQSSYDQELTKFREYLKRVDLRLSKGRQEVFDMVYDCHGHFTSEDLVKICQKKSIKASRATIYRTMRELIEAKVVRKTAFGDKHDNYEHVYDEAPHHHARCVRCGQNTEFPDLGEDQVYRPILEKFGFKVLGHEMHFYGICKKCQE